MFLLLPMMTFAEQSSSPVPPVGTDSAVYQGTCVKLDAFMPVYEAARSAGRLQAYEVAVNVRLQNRFYPTLEGGFSFGEARKDSLSDKIQGGFLRLGMDYNPLKKSRRSPHALLIGLRVGTSLQTQVDAWGELNVGCEVQIVKGLYMGWMARMRLLFTNRNAQTGSLPIYIPGYGYRDNMAWGANYYIGWQF